MGSGGQCEDVTESSVAGITPHLTRLFGTVTPEPDTTLTTTDESPRSSAPTHTSKPPLDTKRIRSALVLSSAEPSVECLPGRAGDKRGDDVGGVPIE